MDFEPTLRLARLTGFIRGGNQALNILAKHGLAGHPAYFEILRLICRVDEHEASRPVAFNVPARKLVALDDAPPKPFTVIDGGAA